jgi:hypothetical protein
MFKNLLLFFALILCQNTSAQVAKTVIVEHFTNTRCGICGFKNPQLFANLDNHPEVLHLSTHPSAPYSNCILYQHNSEENDARTNFYGLYGSTPRVVIQGEVIGGGPFNDEELFTPYEGQTSPASINIQQSKTAESIEAFITVQTEELHDLGDLQLYIVLAEDTLFYDAPNGEDLHFDVFRKNVSEANGFPLTLPAEISGEVTFSISADMHEDWVAERIFVMAILQDVATNEVIQAAAVSASMNVTISENSTLPILKNVAIFPNPTSDILVVQLEDSSVSTGRVFNLSGKLILEKTFQTEGIFNIEKLLPGAYLLEIENENGRAIEKVIVE